MEFKKYSYISKFLNNFLKQSKNDEGVFLIPWLHFLRVHKDENISNYKLEKDVNDNVIYKIILLIVRLIYNSFYYKKPNYIKNVNCEDIYISHLISLPDKNRYGDIYFPNDWRNKNSITFLINHTHISEKKLRGLLQDKFHLLSKYSSFTTSFYFVLKSFRAYFKIKGKLKYQTNVLNKRLISRAAIEAISFATVTNYNIKEQCLNIFKETKPKKVFFTLEGHAYERAIISAAREVSCDIKCFGYQHSSFFYSQNAIFQTYSKRYDPDVVLTTGPLASKYAKNRFKNKFIKFQVVGTNKRFKEKKTKGNVCLIAPEGYKSEVEILLDFSKRLAFKRPHVEFILRLHPRLHNSKILKKLIHNDLIPNNILISQNDLIEDLRRSKVILYRGSTVAIQAGSMGITPVYLKLKKEITIDPLFNIGQNELKITSIKQFYDIYDERIKIPNFKTYCNDYYVPLKKIKNRIKI